MSQENHAAHDADTEEKKKEAKKVGMGILGGIVVFIVIVMIFKAILPHGESTTTNQSNDNQNAKNAAANALVSEPDVITFPAHDPIVVDITGELSKSQDIPAGYYLTFVCDQDYQIVDGNGKPYDGEAHKDVNIGLYHSSESTANLTLKFRTRNNSTTKMKVILSPMTIKNPNKK